METSTVKLAGRSEKNIVCGGFLMHSLTLIYSKVTIASSRYLRRSSVPAGHIMVSVCTVVM